MSIRPPSGSATSVAVAGINTQTDNYTLVLEDAGKLVQLNKATGITLTVPPNSSVPFPVGTVIDVTQIGAGGGGIAPGSGVTIGGSTTITRYLHQYGGARLIKTGTNTWDFISGTTSPGAGADSERYGARSVSAGASSLAVGFTASAAGANGSALGYAASAAGAQGTAVGRSSVASGADGPTAAGYAATASGLGSTALGGSTVAAASSSVAVGKNATVHSSQLGSVAIGYGASAAAGTFGSPQVAVGYNARANEGRATAIGAFARGDGISSTVLGRGAIGTGSHSIAIGRGAWANAANMIAIGFSGGDSQTDVYFESGHTHKWDDPIDTVTVTRNPSSTPIAIHGFDAYDATASPTSDVAGGSLILAAGRGTGTAAGGAVSLQVAPAGGASNNTKNTLVKVVEADAGAAGGRLGFFAATPAAKPTGVAVTAEGIHAALVTLGLIAA